MRKISLFLFVILFCGAVNLAKAADNPPDITNIQMNIKPETTWTLLVYGSNFGTETGVLKFNGTEYSVSSWKEGEIKAEVPAEMIEGNLAVITKDGLEAAVDFKLNLKPTISSINPAIATASEIIHIYGYKFGASSGKVLFNNIEGEIKSWNSYEIEAAVPKTGGYGEFKILIQTLSGETSNQFSFKINPPPAPQILYMSPASGTVGAKITLSGKYFGSTAGTIELNGIKILSTSWQDTSIEFIIPKDGVSGNIFVSNEYGKSNSAPFLVIPLPLIDSVTPLEITPGITQVTVTGKGFKDNWYVGSDIYFDNMVSDKIVEWTDNKIIAVPPPQAKAGKITLKIIGFSEIIEGPKYTIKSTIDFINPPRGKAGDKVIINGKSFGDLKGKVKAGSAEAEIISWTNTAIEIIIPAGANSEGVTVFTADNIKSDLIPFTALPVISNDPYSHFQYYLSQIKAVEGWKTTGGNNEVTVAVIDDGIDVNHPDLNGNIWRNKKEIAGNGKDDDKNGYTDDIIGWNFIDKNNELSPRGNHGTMVGGIIGAAGNNQIGIIGVSPKIKLMPLIVCDKEGNCDSSVINKAIHYAVDNGAQIVNLSLGGPWFTNTYSNMYDEALQYAYNHGVFVVAAAGNGDMISNQGRNLNLTPSSPVCNDGKENLVIGVAAVDEKDIKTTWSDYGSNCIDISAPGKQIYSTVSPAHDPNFNTKENISKFGYKEGDGTSFAAPQVSGALALIKSLHPTWSFLQARDALLQNNDNIDGLNPNYKGQIGRRLNIAKALQLKQPATNINKGKEEKPKNEKIPNKKTVKKTKEVINLKVSTPQNGKVTISWDKPKNATTIYKYVVYLRNESDTEWKLLLNENGKLYLIDSKQKEIKINLEENRVYTIRVTILFKNGKESEGEIAEADNR